MSIQGQAIRAAPAVVEAGPLPPEIAFLSRHGVDERILREAAEIAVASGVTADQAALKCDLLTEAIFYKALADELGCPFFEDVSVDERARFPENVLAGVAPLASATGQAGYAVAPTGAALLRLLERRYGSDGNLAITTPSALRQGVLRAKPRSIAWHAAYDLPERKPEWSFSDNFSWLQVCWAAALSASVAVVANVAPGLTLTVVMALSGVVFLGMVVLRMSAVRERIPTEPTRRSSRYDDRDLPVYTVIVALHRERRVLNRLVDALMTLDYPRAKLDIKLVIEADDGEMHEAFAALPLPGPCEVIVAPPGLPRTKPRALNIALPLARGEFITVYDAEDVPHPGQLRLAVETFARMPLNVGCLQARLVIDNTEDSWITRLFTIEYATLFDVINPGLSRLDMPVPLGGTSNHFRKGVLQRLGGWDAWNVTEDADLGIRLALAGYRVGDLPSPTLEEAPAALKAWMKQRTRWMKGFMQVCVTHSRHPLRALRTLGAARFFGAVSMTLGTVIAALGYPIFMALSLKGLIDQSLFKAETPLEVITSALGIVLFVSGMVAIIVPPLAALSRRGWWGLLPYVPLLPFYYVLVSVAAWRSVAEFFLDPFRWHKTEHGLARTSRAGMFRDAGADPEPPGPEGGRG